LVDAGHGGCGEVYERPLVNGVPIRTWGLDCERCEAYLSGSTKPMVLVNIPGDLSKGVAPRQERRLDPDPCWSTNKASIPLTPDEARDSEFLRNTGQHQIDAMQALSSAITAGLKIPEPMMQLLRRSLPADMIPGVVLCAAGHDNMPGARFCSTCGMAMAALAEVAG
jgi:hypothetical protein